MRGLASCRLKMGTSIVSNAATCPAELEGSVSNLEMSIS